MPTYKAIASTTVGSGGASSITFSSIPQTYTDLVIKLSTRSGFDWIRCQFNSSGGTAYSSRWLSGNGSSAGSGSSSGDSSARATIVGQTDTANTFGNAEVYIPNYTSSNYKSLSGDGVSEANQTAAYAYLTASLWSNTSAITSITLTLENAGNFVQYSTATLYGIKNSQKGNDNANQTRR